MINYHPLEIVRKSEGGFQGEQDLDTLLNSGNLAANRNKGNG